MPRIFDVPFEPAGLTRYAPRDIIAQLVMAPQPKWPLAGPQSLVWVLEFCLAQTGALLNARVAQFMQLARLSYNDPSMTEYAVIGKCVEFALYTDQVMICNMVSFELLIRRFQLIEERYRHKLPQMAEAKGTALDGEQDASLFLGLGTQAMAGRLAVCVMPALSEFIAGELGKEAALNKGRVKAHELRQQIKRLQTPAKAKGGGKDE